LPEIGEVTLKILLMEFDKNKDEAKNIQILKSEIKKIKKPYSKILLDALEENNNPDEFRVSIKEKIHSYIDSKSQK
jgi:basic membrane lipoprotein Med (substrate-binding protein (PBP1-ABC) superfamily)